MHSISLIAFGVFVAILCTSDILGVTSEEQPEEQPEEQSTIKIMLVRINKYTMR